MADLILKHINKIYPNNVHAVCDFNIEIKDKEFIVFVGPSGCGKSTTLRMIAGLEEITTGEFYIDGKLMNYVMPKDRNVAMVFQNYALYPHMTVYKNMSYGLSIKKELMPIYEHDESIDKACEEIKKHKKNLSLIVKKMSKNEDNADLKNQYDDEFNAISELTKQIIANRKPIIGKDIKRINEARKNIEVAEKEINFVTNLLNKEIAESTNDEELINMYRDDIDNYTKVLEENTKLLEQLENHDTEIYKRRKMYKYEIDAEVFRAADILDLKRYLNRLPSALSGGQRQRVALGRAIVRRPQVFLMDEPLSNLDAKLRVQTRGEILALHKRVGATTIYVTHDQTEAMTLADRIVIMKDGYVQQIAKPMEAFDDPANIFVGGFIGSPAMNFIKGTYEKGVFKANNGLFTIDVPKELIKPLENNDSENVILGIRPEHIFLDKSGDISLEITTIELLGNEMVIYTNTFDNKIAIKVSGAIDPSLKGAQKFKIDKSKLYFFNEKTTNRIK